MSSIMTNAAALTALQSLNATNKSLEMTQARISTGYRVAEASDNAAYWSIATTMRSDNQAMSTVSDAMMSPVTVLPCAAYIELSLAAATEILGPQRFSIEDIDLKKVLFFPKGITQTLQVILTQEVDARKMTLRRPGVDLVKHASRGGGRVLGVGGQNQHAADAVSLELVQLRGNGGANLARGVAHGVAHGDTVARLAQPAFE